MIEVKNQYPEERDTLNPYNKFLFGDRLDKLQVTINYQTILVACFILAIPNSHSPEVEELEPSSTSHPSQE